MAKSARKRLLSSIAAEAASGTAKTEGPNDSKTGGTLASVRRARAQRVERREAAKASLEASSAAGGKDHRRAGAGAAAKVVAKTAAAAAAGADAGEGDDRAFPYDAEQLARAGSSAARRGAGAASTVAGFGRTRLSGHLTGSARKAESVSGANRGSRLRSRRARAARRAARAGSMTSGTIPVRRRFRLISFSRPFRLRNRTGVLAGVAGGGVGCGCLTSLAALLLAPLLLALLAAFTIGAAQAQANLDGLPPYITADMVRTSIECQEEYGHPAGCTIAQVIAESGVGDHLSGLASEPHFNLFGIKWSDRFKGEPEVTGSTAWGTKEEYADGTVDVTALFTDFTSHGDCIRFRSRVMLSMPRYATNELIVRAIEERDSMVMAEGLKDAGWATSSSYVATLKNIIETYDLTRFDRMTVEDWDKLIASGGTGQEYEASSEVQRRIADAARSTPATPANYCAMWVSNVYRNAGLGYIGGNACDQYRAWCHSSDRSALEVGMLIGVDSYPGNYAGQIYGHVGIYVGDGIVLGNEGGRIVERTLDDFIRVYGGTCEVRWGYPSSVTG